VCWLCLFLQLINARKNEGYLLVNSSPAFFFAILSAVSCCRALSRSRRSLAVSSALSWLRGHLLLPPPLRALALLVCPEGGGGRSLRPMCWFLLIVDDDADVDDVDDVDDVFDVDDDVDDDDGV
jgi:hypothetical protein